MAVINGADNHTIIQAQKDKERNQLGRLVKVLENSVGLNYTLADDGRHIKLIIRPKDSVTVEDLFDIIAKKLADEPIHEIRQQLEEQSDRIVDEIHDGFWK